MALLDTSYPKNIVELKKILLTYFGLHRPVVGCGAQTSTVLPFTRLQNTALLNLSQMEHKITMEGEYVRVQGGVSWQELIDFLQLHQRTAMTFPTEKSALVLSAIATSATGEYAFGLGPVRDQVQEICFIDLQMRQHRLFYDQSLEIAGVDFSAYQQSFAPYKDYKNGPFPRLERQTDLMVGSEGQLGIVTEALFKTRPLEATVVIFIKLPRWQDNFSAHLEIFKQIQKFRGQILSCEILDSNSLHFGQEQSFGQEVDIIVLEVFTHTFDQVYEQFLAKLSGISDKDIFEIPATRFHQLRHKISEQVNEYSNSRGREKRGTDVQILGEHFKDLLNLYREFSKVENMETMLFGHFGDGHPHFNFLASRQQLKLVDTILKEQLYPQVKKWQGTPFAEHGVGLIKRPYIKEFYTPVQYAIFKQLKDRFDPQRILFPQGFMNFES